MSQRRPKGRVSCYPRSRTTPRLTEGHEQVADAGREEAGCQPRNRILPGQRRQVKSIDDFLKDYRIYSYAMKAFGLSDMIYAKAFMRKVLTEGISTARASPTSCRDPRYREFATAFNFALLGARATQTTAAQNGTATQYVQQVDGGGRRRPERGRAPRALLHAQGLLDQDPLPDSRRQGADAGRANRPRPVADDQRGRYRQAGVDAVEAHQFFRLPGSGQGQPLRAAFRGDVGCKPGPAATPRATLR